MKNAAITIIFTENKQEVLLIKRRDIPLYVFPGGGIEESETPETAAIRETLEETGLTVKILRKIGEYTPLNRLGSLTHVFECERESGNLAIGEETKEISFFSIHQLPKNFFLLHQDFLEDALKYKETVKKNLNRLTYLNVFLFFLKHPLLVFYALMARFKNKAP